MIEKKMGYRGSKSVFQKVPRPNEISVKEQRVDGSYFGSGASPKLRCTLTGLERGYQIKIPSKHLNSSYFCSSSTASRLNP